MLYTLLKHGFLANQRALGPLYIMKIVKDIEICRHFGTPVVPVFLGLK